MIQLPNWPYLTRDVPGMPGVVKSCPEDFVVEEIPIYPCSGEGTHVFFVIEKTPLMRKIDQILSLQGSRTVSWVFLSLSGKSAVS